MEYPTNALLEIDPNVETRETACRTSSLIGGVFKLHLFAGPSGDPPPHLCDPLEIQKA